MVPAIDYQGLVERLKACFGQADLHDPAAREVCDRMCRNLTPLLDVERDIPLEDLIDRLEQKWRADGLINTQDD